ncbi:[protein-PII] uridylyltransferase [uncultured Jatrophihabitans sp.]|uniref:[protein-PII] uridylyltransferase n=1 Tax=uncultured Jatrophihabitans sp. TaxID=1610747 RepID=UPI0035CBF7CA
MREALCTSYDEWLRSLLAPRQGVALVAVGGLGRREPAPYSDLDLVLLHDGKVDGLSAVADAIWYPIWDSGIGLDHSVRTPEQALAVAREDLKALLGLLDIRHLAGDAGLTGRVRSGILEVWRATAAKRVGEMRQLSRARWAIAGEGAFLLEPNLKDSRGGLRDGQAVRALAAAQLVDFPIRVREAYPVLLDVRGELHRITGRAEDVLRQQEQDGVAATLGCPAAEFGEPRDVLLRRVNEAARSIAHTLDLAWRRVDAQTARPRARRRLFGSSRPVVPDRVGMARNVVAQDGEVMLARDADPWSDPGLVLRVARVAAEQDLPIAPFALERLATESAPLPTPWPRSALDDLLAVLGVGKPAIPVLESLDQAGLLVALIPEWDAVRCRAQHNPVHKFTVDRHLLETAALAAQDGEVDRRDLLIIGALLHDIGKGYPPEDHSVVGAAHAKTIATRLGYPAEDVAMIVGLTRHHLLLPNTATRRDPDDPMTVQIVRDSVGESADLLDMLQALATADALATGPAAWSEWKEGLIAELARRARAAMRGTGVAPGVAPLDDERRVLAEARELAVVVRPAEVIVAAPDQTGTLYRTTGVLALHSLDVREASIRTHAGMAVNRFVVEPRFGTMPDASLVRSDLARALKGELGLASRLAEKERAYSRRPPGAARRHPSVHWFDDSKAATVVEFRGEDEVGLLSRITAALERAGLDVRSARISSVAGQVVDAFYVTDRSGRVVPAERRPELEVELRSAWAVDGA